MPQPLMADTAALFQHIADAHLFGHNLSADGDVPVTNLDCRVTSITKVFNEHGSDVSRATISIAGAPDKRYQVGTVQDTDTGTFWIQRAADQKFQPAVSALGLMQPTIGK